ncbi:MAG: hypothetical protein ACD_30C00101G0003 [uncultured bacterium]|uniref:Uncharacterized protein n=3 Tax=Candidatus Daviesiibacteriota TaxID=1752718 RepID=A0A0G0H9X9_9BACT|nr:MAG: hypothetical protein ACD_30C00101G0003 [uncultured bacterium]KKQ08889.1 MAG: hypothetical protein US19_C0018G0006 [Candidatus Daviesbacteria bacterium GW2011_GWB1_36_5]KKQ13880.1 MAG: hypothetical protein US28_C0043G0011 [Candidatus Daviesbacteria bacterium GW2011_GWA1_36_8]OGE34337.1 MAG: hypothetical protein A3E66_04945 [Candidatus Daviesbacteria bacterium RIFCSPHIGHO2_12_FULL_37_16]
MRSGGHITAVIAVFIFLVGAFYILAPKGAKVEESQVIDKCVPPGPAGEVIPYNGASYKQIRAQVQIEAKLFKDRRYSSLFEPNFPKSQRIFDVYFPTSIGKTANRLINPRLSQTEGQVTNKFYLIDNGLIFLVHKDVTSLQPKTISVGGTEFWKTDVYQDLSMFNPSPVPDEIFFCPDNPTTSPPTPTLRSYEGSPDGNQIQLDFFDFSSNPTPLDPTLVLIE